MLRFTQDPSFRWLTTGGTFVLVTLILSITSYFRERQRLNAFMFVTLVRAQSRDVDVEYSDDRRFIRAGPGSPDDALDAEDTENAEEPEPEDDAAEAAVLPMRPDGQPERRRGDRRRSDAS